MPHNTLRKIYKALLLTALIALSTTTFAQSDSDEYSAISYDPTNAFVLALSGLRLREFPGTASKILTTIPFASKVTLMRDPTLARNEDDGYLFDADSIRGNWVSVKYQDKTGYVFDAYLGNQIYKMNKASYLIMPDAAGCWSDAYASKVYHYYGVYLDKSKQQASLKTIKPVFHSDHDEFEAISMHAPGKERPYFMLATREPLAEDGPINRHHFFSKIDFDERIDDPNQVLKNDSILHSVRIPDSNWELSCVKQKEQDSNPPYYGKVVQLKDRNTGQKQIILDKSYFLTTARMVWCGDLDRDGIQDFLLMAGGEESGFCALFLSRNAGKGKLMRLAGMYWWGDCC
jgi:hypothetical protein